MPFFPGMPAEFLCWSNDTTKDQQSGGRLADEVRARASKEASPVLRAEWELLAENYARLAEQSEATSRVGVVYDPILDILKPWPGTPSLRVSGALFLQFFHLTRQRIDEIGDLPVAGRRCSRLFRIFKGRGEVSGVTIESG